MTVTIKITKEEVYDKAMRLADYTVAKVPGELNQNGDVYDCIAITNLDLIHIYRQTQQIATTTEVIRWRDTALGIKRRSRISGQTPRNVYRTL